VGGPYYPDVSGNYVAYQGSINIDWDIYLYNFTSNFTYDASENLASQENPSISVSKYANFIVYQEASNGNWDIYLAGFWYGAIWGGSSSSLPITPSRVISSLQEVKSRIADTPVSDFAGANNRARENKKDTLLHHLDSAIADVENAVSTQNLKLRNKCLQSAIDQLASLPGKLDGRSLRGAADLLDLSLRRIG
jgi:hypothetical protein